MSNAKPLIYRRLLHIIPKVIFMIYIKLRQVSLANSAISLMSRVVRPGDHWNTISLIKSLLLLVIAKNSPERLQGTYTHNWSLMLHTNGLIKLHRCKSQTDSQLLQSSLHQPYQINELWDLQGKEWNLYLTSKLNPSPFTHTPPGWTESQSNYCT